MIRYLLHYISAVPDVDAGRKGKLAYNIRSLQLMLFLCYILCFNSVLFYFWHCTFFLTQKIVISCCYCYYIYAATVVTSLFLLQYIYIPMKVYVQHKTHNTHTQIFVMITTHVITAERMKCSTGYLYKCFLFYLSLVPYIHTIHTIYY